MGKGMMEGRKETRKEGKKKQEKQSSVFYSRIIYLKKLTQPRKNIEK